MWVFVVKSAEMCQETWSSDHNWLLSAAEVGDLQEHTRTVQLSLAPDGSNTTQYILLHNFCTELLSCF